MAMWKNDNTLKRVKENYVHTSGWGLSKPVHLRSIPSEGKPGYYGDKNLLKINNGAYSDGEIYDMLSGYVFNEEDIIDSILEDFRSRLEYDSDNEYFTRYYKDEDDFDEYLRDNNEEIREQIDYILNQFNLDYRPLKK